MTVVRIEVAVTGSAPSPATRLHGLGPRTTALLRIPQPVAGVLFYPAEPTMRQMWRALKVTVGPTTPTLR